MGKQRRTNYRDKRKQARDHNPHLNTRFAMAEIQPLTEHQEDMFDAYYEDRNIVAVGSAGTGKTMCAMYLGLSDVLANTEYKRIVIVRSAVQTRDMGFTPGTKQQKEAEFSTPYSAIVNELFQRGDAWEILLKKGQIVFTTTSFIRGITLDNAIIISDECQSLTFHELDTVITRAGKNTKIIFCGDTKQDDLKSSRNRADVSGLPMFLNILENMNSFEFVEFNRDDIVRSGLVKEYIIEKEKYESMAA
jgi:phosphate starvation-inducible PhoH-like protein